jgi:O-acetyl-ADP-ribose deacetylase (regulator of RNase III)
MIHEVDANLLEYPLRAICHQANCFNTMGSGIAYQIKLKYPEAYEADCETKRGDKSKLGYFSYVLNEEENKYIINFYGQYQFGRETRHTDYNAWADGLPRIIEFCVKNNITSIGIPRLMGCKLGGGNWNIARVIIEEAFKDAPVDLWICNYDK